MKESNLSPPVLAKNKGTVVFRLVPLQGEVSGSELDYIPILHLSRAISMNTVLPSPGEVSGSVLSFIPILRRSVFLQ